MANSPNNGIYILLLHLKAFLVVVEYKYEKYPEKLRRRCNKYGMKLFISHQRKDVKLRHFEYLKIKVTDN